MDPFSSDVCGQLRDWLVKSGKRIVFAESCTAGLIAASMGRFPGISQYLAGSAVVYQLETKSGWLKVKDRDLEDPGPVSRVVSEQMASGALAVTDHADVAAAVTGHLGPDAPPELDGVAWTTIAIRTEEKPVLRSRQLQLDVPGGTASEDIRGFRQTLAVEEVIEFSLEVLLTNHS
ncbi:MAG TPA: damage-inducible protein [Planctomycetaceae bacterium]|nr:damage-inducible protein [Planctomycetaceae bacterium]